VWKKLGFGKQGNRGSCCTEKVLKIALGLVCKKEY